MKNLEKADNQTDTTSGFAQYEIPDRVPSGYSYRYIRGLEISAVSLDAGSGDSLNHLEFKLKDVLQDTGKYPGIEAKNGTTWESKVEDVLHPAIVPPTPFDFGLWFPSRIIIILTGKFWRFSTAMAPFTTKARYGDQYCNLLLHDVESTGLISLTRHQWALQRPERPCKCISFYSKEPARDSALPPLGSPKVVHGFSLNVEFGRQLANGDIDPSIFLPITIDPDIENKGGHP